MQKWLMNGIHQLSHVIVFCRSVRTAWDQQTYAEVKDSCAFSNN
jgi:hypothetical protein